MPTKDTETINAAVDIDGKRVEELREVCHYDKEKHVLQEIEKQEKNYEQGGEPD